MRKSRKFYLAARYQLRTVRAMIEKMRLSIVTGGNSGKEMVSPLWSIFITFNCTSNCSYCIQNYSFINGRKASPLSGEVQPEYWLKLNEIKDKPDSIVITGGEPLLYKGLAYLLGGLHTFKQIQVVTNLTLDISRLAKHAVSIKTHKVLFECSYHEDAIDFETFVSRAYTLKQAGLLGSVRMVDVTPKKTLKYISKFADYDLELMPLYQVGFKDGKLSVFSNEQASDLIRKPPVLCKVSLVLFSPDGYLYNCHTKLYWSDHKSSFGNIVTGFEIPSGYYICHDYGFCNPCQVGYMDVKNINEVKGININKKVLFSNPPIGVHPTKNCR